MRSNKLALYHIAKYTSYELLIEGLLLKKGTNQSNTLEKIKRKERSLKLRIFRTKILYAIIFGILPVAPLLGYFKMDDILLNSSVSTNIIIFHGSLFIVLFFTLQIFNFILMGMLEVGTIMSGQSFEWLKTLPISRNKLKKVVLLTIFRSFDAPIIVMVMTFPIVMFIGTLNLIVFLISIGISILNAFFSFSILIIIGCRMNRILEVNQLNSKKSQTIRILNLVSYVVAILGSVYLVQWAFSSIEVFFTWFLDLPSPALTNIILSSIPYPFNPSYLTLVSIFSNGILLNLWVSIIIGFLSFALITYWLFDRALQQVEMRASSKFQDSYSKNFRKWISVEIKSTSPFRAYLRKDLVQISHDFKTFLTVITTFLLSFLFSYYFNLGYIGRIVPTETLIYTNWLGLLLISPVISGMLISNFLSLEDTGQSILTSLPIIHRDQAKAKLFLIFIFQTSAVILPTVMYIPDLKFDTLFVATLGALPLIWSFLLFLFEMKIKLFGKKRDYYIIEEVNQDNRMFKWTIIMCIQYILGFLVISLTFNLYKFLGYNAMTSFWIFGSEFGLVIGIIIFLKMFPKISIELGAGKEVMKWFTANFNYLIKTIVTLSIKKGNLLTSEQSMEIIKEEYFISNPIRKPWISDKDRGNELESLIDYMIDDILRVANRIFLLKLKN